METIYDNAEFLLHDLYKVGIVGVNGAGKTLYFVFYWNSSPWTAAPLSLGESNR